MHVTPARIDAKLTRMQFPISRSLPLVVLAVLLQACATTPVPDPTLPGPRTRQIISQRLSSLVVTSRTSIGGWLDQHLSAGNAPADVDGGSATPITSDGYFITADHVLANSSGRHIFVLYGNGGNIRSSPARVVWRQSQGDVALVHAPIATPYYYHWSPAKSWRPAGTPVTHGGISTGFKSGAGKLRTTLSPEGWFTGTRSFKIDIPLQPGDSGGPVIDAQGYLIGVNSAVEFLVPMETAFFVDSEGNRPNLRHLQSIIARDRRARRAAAQAP